MPPLAAVLLLAVETEERVKPLAARSILITLAVILAICGAILLAGFGYFSPGNDDKK